MTDAKLIDEVIEMRRWQVRYFRYREPKALQYAKDYERRVDAELKRRTVPGLFDKEAQ